MMRLTTKEQELHELAVSPGPYLPDLFALSLCGGNNRSGPHFIELNDNLSFNDK